MSSNHLVIILPIFTLLLASVTIATDYIVGGDKGWTLDFDYQEWAKDKVFHIGDKLVFKYQPPNHNVYKVNGTSFKDCIIPPDSNGALTTGNDIVPLSTPGRKWYICGVGNHCAERKMKLVINIEAEGPISPPSSSAHAFLLSSGYLALTASVIFLGCFLLH